MSGDSKNEESQSDFLFDGEELAQQFRQFQLLFVAVKAGIPAALAEKPQSLTEISNRLERAAPRLQRVLRGLVWCRALETTADGAYFLTKAGRALLDGGPRSLAAGIRFQGEFFFNAWGHLWDYLETGDTPFQRAHGGATLFDLLEADDALAAVFGAPMTAHSAAYSRQIASHPVFVSLRTHGKAGGASPLIVDVGGGEGRLLVDILTTYPDVHGILLELPILEAAATNLIAGENLSNRCRFVGGDMFAAVPADGDVYLLKWVLHDWKDGDASRILHRCAEAMGASASAAKSNKGDYPRLLIIERLMPDRVDATNTGLVQADLNMLCQMGGAERTLTEYEQLLAAAGLRLVSVERLNDAHGFVVLECALLNR